MRILIDFTQIPLKKVGVGNYAMFLLRGMICASSDMEIYIVVLSDDKEILDHLTIKSHGIKLIRINKIFRRLLLRFIFEQIFLPFIILWYNIQTIHSLHYSFPLLPLPVKKVVTLHDMTFFLYPDFHKNFYVYFFKFMITSSLRMCHSIICVSESTKSDVIKILNLSEFKKNRLRVVPLCTDYSIDYSGNILTLKKYNLLEKNYFLFVGTLEPRKNVISIILAFASFCELSKRDMRLVIVGREGWHFDSIYNKVVELHLEDKVLFTGYVEESEKKDLLHYSYLFIYPSFYEGFGIPVLEAMSYGIPTITSNISSMPEVAGDAAVLVDPMNIIEIREAMLRLVSDELLYKDLIIKSLIQSKKFNLSKMILDTADIYRL
jgi:glycosyltransferase involved in cell wall biosynthesis